MHSDASQFLPSTPSLIVGVAGDAPTIRGRVFHQSTGVGLPGLRIRFVDGHDERNANAPEVRSDADGAFEITPERITFTWQGEHIRTSDDTAATIEIEDIDGVSLGAHKVYFAVGPSDSLEIGLPAGETDAATQSHLLESLLAFRQSRIADVAAQLAGPAADNPMQAIPVRARMVLLERLGALIRESPERAENADPNDSPGILADERLLDPQALSDGRLTLFDFTFGPGGEYVGFPLRWPKNDEESYRDYLRGVFVLFIHQQAVGFQGNLTQWTSVIERQLAARFFQDFRTGDHASTRLNKLLVPIVVQILTAPTGSGFGFGLTAAAIPPQATTSDRQYLDQLLALASVGAQEFANRYRLPLDQPDSTMSTPVLLNVHTLKHILCDTAQGPVEETAISPQLPGYEGKPILWDNVVGAAPFFLRYDEWLGRQTPFYPENLFSLRSQIQACVYSEPWLDKGTEDYLNYHQAGHPASSYGGQFGSTAEAQQSAKFLLAFGNADRKLFEVSVAIDRGEFDKALRLTDEANALLTAARNFYTAGGAWEPSKSPLSNFPRPMSFAKRRNLAVTSIEALTGVAGAYPAVGFERFFEIPRLRDLWSDNITFADARGLATRLVRYQRTFLLPILRGTCYLAKGNYAAAVNCFARVSGFYAGAGRLATPAGGRYNPNDPKNLHSVHWERSFVLYGRDTVERGDLPYTARLNYKNRQLQAPELFDQQVYDWGLYGPPVPEMKSSDLHRLEVRFLHLVQGEAMLQWAEALYRSDEPDSLERARELYKAVLLLHGVAPDTVAYDPTLLPPWPTGLPTNPRRQNQLERARLGLYQLRSGLNFYGFQEDAVPMLRYSALVDAAGRWSIGAKSAQNDYINYMGRIEQLDLDLLAARAQQKKAQASVEIAGEQIEVAKAGVVVANRVVADVEKKITEKQQEIDDAKSIFNQFKDYFSGMKDSVTSLVDVAKGAKEGVTATGIATEEGVKTAVKGMGSEAMAGVGAGGVAVVGAFAGFAVLSTITLNGMADAETKRAGDLKTLRTQTLAAAQAAVRVQERMVHVAQLQQRIAATDLDYAKALIAYQSDRFLNRDFWNALASIARRGMSRQIDLAAQAAWLAERALAYQIAQSIRIVRLNYSNAAMRDVGSVDRLSLDLVELEAVRLASTRLRVPIRHAVSLARDFPLAYGQLKRMGRCALTMSDEVLQRAYPGTFCHRIRSVDVAVEAPGALPPPRGMLCNAGLSFLRMSVDGQTVPLVRFEDALPVSEFRMRNDMQLQGLPGEQLLPFEGSGFATEWSLEISPGADTSGLSRLTDVVITFDLQANYGATSAPAPALPVSRALLTSALALDTAGMASLRNAGAIGKVRFAIGTQSIPGGAMATITNAAVLLPGVDAGNFSARLIVGSAVISFTIEDGIAMSNSGVLSDGVAANVLPLNALVGTDAAQDFVIEIDKGADADLIVAARDVTLWLEYESMA